MEVKWTELKIGDRVRILDWPPELKPHLCAMSTIAIYRYIINTGSVLIVDSIDDVGIPVGKIVRARKNGGRVMDWLGLNHSQIDRIDE